MKSIVSTVHGVQFVNNQSVLEELAQNNCTMPNIDRVIFNLGKKAYPQRDEKGKRIKDKEGKLIYGPEVTVLATTIFFCDKTKVTVVNSEHDGLELQEHTLSNGEKIQVATHESKERGVIYGIFKRLISIPNEDGTVTNSGLGRILNDIIDNSYDTDIEEREHKIMKAKSKAKYEEAKKNSVPKRRKYSIAETLARLNKLLDNVDGVSPDILNKVANVFKDC